MRMRLSVSLMTAAMLVGGVASSGPPTSSAATPPAVVPARKSLPKSFEQPIGRKFDASQPCAGMPDLAIMDLTTTTNSPGWVWACATVQNSGGLAWSSRESQVGVAVVDSLGGRVIAGGIASLAPGVSLDKCGWVRVPGLLRIGVETLRSGECEATMTLTAQLQFDLDIRNDGNPANDDCLASDNARSVSVAYTTACPW